jgi:hypothetical protein
LEQAERALVMPTIAWFYGIMIQMYYNDRPTDCAISSEIAQPSPPSQTDLPDGRRADFPVQPPSKKYSGFPKTQISAISSAVSSH